MNAYQPHRAPLSPWWFRGLIAAGIIAFLVAVIANAAQAAVLNADYYQDVLDDEQAYERAYEELSTDAALFGSTQDLLGGVEIPFLDSVPGLLLQAIPVETLERVMDQAIEDLIAYLKKHKDLELTLDITPFVDGVPGAGIINAATQIGGLPVEEAPSFDAFTDDLDDLIEGISGEGSLPASLTVFPIENEAQEQQVVDLIVDGTGLDPETPDALSLREEIEDGIATGSPDGAIGPALGPLLSDVSAGAALDLKAAKFVREEQVEGETRFVVGPPADVVAKIDDALFAVQLIASNSYWMRPLAAVLFVVALAAIVYLSRRDRVAMANRIGMVLLIGGLAGFLLWLIAVPIVQGIVIDAAFEGGRAPSEAFDDLARDVLRRSVSNLTPYIWLPSLTVAGMGVALVVLARFVLPRPVQTRFVPAARP